MYYQNLKKTISHVLSKAEIDPIKILGIGISGMAPDALPISSKGEPLYPCILWIDRRAEEEAEIIRKRIGEDLVYQITGNCIDPYYGLVKALWIRRNEPQIYKQSAKILNLKDYIAGRLTGNFVTDYSHAGLSGIAFDLRKNSWNEEILTELDLDSSKLPDLYPSDAIIGTVSKEAAEELGLTEGIPVVAGMVDSAASYLACGILEAGENAMSLGTSSCWGIYHESEVLTRGMNITRAPWNHRGFLTNASQAATGAIFTWLRDTFASERCMKHGLKDEQLLAIMNEEAEKVPPGCEGLLTLPHFMGERTPIWDPQARGVFFGLTLSHTIGHLYRSVVEGMAFNFLINLGLLKNAGLSFKKEVIVTGGCARSSLVRKILADILDTRVLYLEGDSRADYADAWLAGKGVGVFSDYRLMKKKLKILDTYEPNPELHGYYCNIFETVYKELYPCLKNLFQNLHKAVSSS